MLSVRQKLSLSISWVRRHTIRINKLSQGHIVNNWQNQDWRTQIYSEAHGLHHYATLPPICWVQLELPPSLLPWKLNKLDFNKLFQQILELKNSKGEGRGGCFVSSRMVSLPSSSFLEVYLCVFLRCSLVNSILLENKMLTVNRKTQDNLRETK